MFIIQVQSIKDGEFFYHDSYDSLSEAIAVLDTLDTSNAAYRIVHHHNSRRIILANRPCTYDKE